MIRMELQCSAYSKILAVISGSFDYSTGILKYTDLTGYKQATSGYEVLTCKNPSPCGECSKGQKPENKYFFDIQEPSNLSILSTVLMRFSLEEFLLELLSTGLELMLVMSVK